jgi:hypothetical protein
LDAAKDCGSFPNSENHYFEEAYEPSVGVNMYKLLVALMLIAALSDLKINVSDFTNCQSRQCVQMVEKRSRDVLKIRWTPISLFPEEAKRFKQKRLNI